MPRILWCNPVGTDAFDEETRLLIEAIRGEGFEGVVRSLPTGPPHLEYHTYEHEALGPMLEQFREAERRGYAAGIIGCFYDGGLRELRELVRMPVVGMGEAAMALAATMGHQFSIIVGRRKWVPKMRDNAILYGHERRLASFRSVEMGIPEVAADPMRFLDRVIEESEGAVREDGAEVVVLSEITGPDFWDRVRKELEFPLVDPGVACWKAAEMVADLYERLELSHSKVGGHEPPPG